MLPPARPNSQRRAILTATLGGAAVLTPFPLLAKARRVRFDRAAYDRYVGLMNVGDPRMADYYADDIRFIMGIRGKAEALRLMHRQSPFVKESLEVLFFCSDASGAAAEVRRELRCIKDCADTAIFGRTLRAGEVQRTHGYLLYALNARGLIAEIKGPLPEILEAWAMEAG